MRIKTLIITLLLLSNRILATHQIPDYLIVGNDTLQISSNPLELYFENHKRPKILEDSWCSTACWRGYKAYFKIQNDSLFLVGLYDCCEKNKTINFNQIFTDRDLKRPIYADWVTDTLMSPSGELLNYIHMGYSSTYEKETDYIFEKGILKLKKQYLNSTVESEFKNLDSLRQFFEDKINWDNVPETDTIVRVFVTIKADRQGKIIQKEIRKSSNVFFNFEALRLIGEIKTMPRVIKRDKVVNSGWTLVVLFDPRKRKK